MVKLEFSVKMLFFSITFRFSFELTLFTFSLGAADAPEAQLSGPTQPFSRTTSSSYKVEAPIQKSAQFEEAQVLDLSAITIINLPIYFTLQPTVVSSSSEGDFASYAVASLLIETTTFQQMVEQLLPYLASLYGGATLEDQLNNILANLTTIEANAITTMGILFTVEISAGSSVPPPATGETMEVGIFALPPGLQMTYNGQTINFDETQSSPDYLQTVQDYFSQLQEDNTDNPSLEAADTVPVTQVLFENYFNLVVQSGTSTILSDIQNGATYTSFSEAFASLDFSSLSGSVSRYLQAGLQLPVPSDTSKLAPMYALTNQEVAIAFDSSNNNAPILTFNLETQSTAPSWLSLDLGTGESSLTENMDPSMVLSSQSVSGNWINDAVNIEPILPFTRIFQLTTNQSWTDAAGTAWNMRPFTDDLSALLASATQGEASKLFVRALPSQANKALDDTATPQYISATPGLLIKFKLKQLTGAAMKNVYQVIGTDEATRDFIQQVLDINDPSIISNIDLLTASGDSAYVTDSFYDEGLLVRTNLSTDAEAPDGANTFAEFMTTDGLTAVSDLGPLQANLDNTEALAFLRLLWECSIVHTKGFYLQLNNLDSSIFGNSGVAGVSVLVQFNNNSTDQSIALAYPNYYNVLLIDNATLQNNDITVVGASLQDSTGNDLLVYRSNIRPGCGGFSLQTDTLKDPDIQTNPQDYVESIYQFIQYKVNSISGLSNFQATNWSVPNGATSKEQSDTELLWNFRQTVPIYQLVSLSSPYLAVGKTANLSMRLLDMFGNALPDEWTTTVEVQYNDGLIPPGQWQGVGSNYLVQAANNQPQLTIALSYQSGDIKSQSESQNGTPSALQQAIAKFTRVQQQLQDPNVTVSVSTVLSDIVFTQDNDQTSLANKLATFVGDILTYLTTENADAPTGTSLVFNLSKSYIGTLSTDIIQLDVDLTIARDASKINPDISDLFQEVLSVSSPISAFIPDDSQDGDSNQSGVVPFAQAFEAAYESFAGADTYVKVAQGPKRQTASGATVRALFAVRWGENAGIHVAFPNTGSSPTAAQQPTYFAPTPLSTLLLTDTFSNLYQYNSEGEDPTKVSRTFSNIDLDKWARLFLSQLQLILSPPLATSIAKINGDKYSAFIGAKESLADFITDEVASILEVPGLTPDSSAATRTFEQALLNSLVKDYATSAILQVPATVSVQGSVSSPPPQLFGKVAENDNQGGQVYTLSSGRLDAANESEQFAFLASAKRPKTDAFLNLDDLNFNIGFIQYQFEEDEAKYGFVPSSWLTFVLPQGAPLQQPLGPVQAPIPLRSFPPAPTLIGQQQIAPQQAATTITDSLTWTYGLEMGLPEAEQDQLYFTVRFNDPVQVRNKSAAFKLAEGPGRPAPKNLFEALARFVYEYPQLAPHLANIVEVANGTSGADADNANAVIDSLLELSLGVAGTWKDWENPGLAVNSSTSKTAPASSWSYSLINQLYDTTPAIRLSKMDTDFPWPAISGFEGADVSSDALVRTYTPTGSTENIKTVNLVFDDLYIMTHQSVNVKAFIRRNDDLVPSNAPTGTTVNDAFVYTTASVTFPSVLVPLNQNNTAIEVEDQGSLAQTLEALFNNFIADPNNPEEQLLELRFSLYAESSFTLATNSDMPVNNTVDAGAPILYSGETVATPNNSTGKPELGMNDYIDNHLAPAIENWEQQTATGSASENVYLAMTIYSNVSSQQLPLVIYSELDLPIDNG